MRGFHYGSDMSHWASRPRCVRGFRQHSTGFRVCGNHFTCAVSVVSAGAAETPATWTQAQRLISQCLFKHPHRHQLLMLMGFRECCFGKPSTTPPPPPWGALPPVSPPPKSPLPRLKADNRSTLSQAIMMIIVAL